MANLDLIATAAFGLEAIVARELKQLGYTDQTTMDGRVAFSGDGLAICRANLWLRCADRVLLRFGQFEATDFGTLFDATRALPWADLLSADATFPVNGRSVRSQLHSVPHCQSIVKKAIVESLRDRYAIERFPETGPEFPIEVQILKDQVSLCVDTSGAGLHKRGYRTLTGAAPLRETVAAALVQLSYWNRDRPFLDPFCGTGTIPIEAALLGRKLAPGRKRDFTAEQWAITPGTLWTEARTEADDLAGPPLSAPLVATDRDPQALHLARRHAIAAGVDADVHFQQRELSDLMSSRQYGCVICNPPWGERIGESPEIAELSREMGRVFAGLDTWSVYVLTAQKDFEQQFGRRSDRRRKLYNARIECTYHQFHGPRPPRREKCEGE